MPGSICYLQPEPRNYAKDIQEAAHYVFVLQLVGNSCSDDFVPCIRLANLPGM